MKKKLTQKLLKEYLHYNPDTGVFTRKVAAGSAVIGDIAGSFDSYGYWRISVLGRQYLAHRLAFLYMLGRWPKDQTDHINGNRAENRWENLREVTQRENGLNQKCCVRSTSKVTGVNWSKRGKWRVKIKAKGRRLHLGYYEDFDEAVLIRKQAEEYYGFHENHGRAG